MPATAVGLFSLSGCAALGVHLHVSPHLLENVFAPRLPLASEICFLLSLELCDVAVKPQARWDQPLSHLAAVTKRGLAEYPQTCIALWFCGKTTRTSLSQAHGKAMALAEVHNDLGVSSGRRCSSVIRVEAKGKIFWAHRTFSSFPQTSS